MVTTKKLQAPKGDMVGADGKPTAAWLHYLAELGDRMANSPAQDAASLLAGGQVLVYAQSLWDALVSDVSQGAGSWSPDLNTSLNFTRMVTGVSTIRYPSFILNGALPALTYGVMVKQGNGGGWSVSMGAGFEGTAPVILTGNGDRTLLGFLLTGPATFTGWTVKQIPAS